MESVLENITMDVIEKITNLGLVDDINSQVDDPSDRATLLQSIVDELVDEQIKDMVNVVVGEDDDDDKPEPEPEPEYVMPPTFDEQIGIIEEMDTEYAKRLSLQDQHKQLVQDMKMRVRVLALLAINKDPFTDIRYITTRDQTKLLKIMNSYSDTPFADICTEFNEAMCDILHDSKSTYETMPCYDNTLIGITNIKYDDVIINTDVVVDYNNVIVDGTEEFVDSCSETVV